MVALFAGLSGLSMWREDASGVFFAREGREGSSWSGTCEHVFLSYSRQCRRCVVVES